MKKEKVSLTKEVDEALKSSEIPKIYANGFINTIGIGDVAILLKNGGVPVAVLNVSYTVAKTLAVKLGALISALEDRTGNTIMVTEEISKAMTKKTGEKVSKEVKK